MEERKPIKRNKHIVQLSKDHHFTLLFCWKIRAGIQKKVDTERIKKYVGYFWQTHMQPHFYQEENILFTHVKNEAIQKALNDHTKIATQIQTILAPTENDSSSFTLLANLVDDHVRYEERELFPHLEKVLTAGQLEKIGNALTAQHDDTVKDNFNDAFWE